MKDEVLIIPRRERNEPLLPETGILCINPGDAGFMARMAEKAGGKRHFLYNSKMFVVPAEAEAKNRGFFIAGPAVGSPMAVMTMEKLIAMGAKRITVCGWCGSLCPELQTGQVLLPTWGISEEGTSKHYPLKTRPASADKLRQQLRTVLQKNNLPCHEGPIWTTDAVYRETKGKVAEYAQQSILGVDMEFNALVTVAAYRDVELVAALLVSDQLWGDKWQPGYADKSFRKILKKFLGTLFQSLCQEKNIRYD